MKAIVSEYLKRLGYATSVEVYPNKYRYASIRDLSNKGHINIVYLHKGMQDLERIVSYCPRNICDIVFSEDKPNSVPNNCYLGRLKDPDGTELYITTVHVGAMHLGIEFYLETLKLRTEE